MTATNAERSEANKLAPVLNGSQKFFAQHANSGLAGDSFTTGVIAGAHSFRCYYGSI